jgi:hypothetical protein
MVSSQGTRRAAGAVRRLVDERPDSHSDFLAPAGAWRGGDVVALWPNAELVGTDPRERWIRLSTGTDALFLRAHDWAPADRSRYLAVRLVEAGSGALRPVVEGYLPLADVVALLRPSPAGPDRSTSRSGGRRRRLAAEAGATALGVLTLMGASFGAAALALGLALR